MLLRQSARSSMAAAVIMAALLTVHTAEAVQLEAPASAPCRPGGALVALPDLPEASGVAMSGRTPGRIWAHNDSGDPTLFALYSQGTVTTRVRV